MAVKKEDKQAAVRRRGSGAVKPSARAKADPQGHRTVDRVTQILEEVVYHPGMTFAELVRALGAAKSSVHGFIRGLLAKGWLDEDHRIYAAAATRKRNWSIGSSTNSMRSERPGSRRT
ncbi:MAG TPA: helix-turn-helix domain-containing protein [Burkholderiaceae bacterium]|nr:helix-turn-helix domain-containing protein [Burkholderiaceae bacterium]